jgi:hypothetical protein
MQQRGRTQGAVVGNGAVAQRRRAQRNRRTQQRGYRLLAHHLAEAIPLLAVEADQLHRF